MSSMKKEEGDLGEDLGSRASITASKTIRVNHKMVVKQGILYKRGNLLKMYNKQYHFYLEKRDEMTGLGPYLKYGKAGKNVTACMNLSDHSKGEGAVSRGFLIVKEPTSNSRFKIITP
jgi:hypothetical protein